LLHDWKRPLDSSYLSPSSDSEVAMITTDPPMKKCCTMGIVAPVSVHSNSDSRMKKWSISSKRFRHDYNYRSGVFESPFIDFRGLEWVTWTRGNTDFCFIDLLGLFSSSREKIFVLVDIWDLNGSMGIKAKRQKSFLKWFVGGPTIFYSCFVTTF
jgi:hypothetical protein